MLTAFIKFGDGRVSTDADPKNLAAALRDPRAVFWVDIDKPEDEDYALLDDVFGFHPLAIEDSINRAQRPKIDLGAWASFDSKRNVCWVSAPQPSTSPTPANT